MKIVNLKRILELPDDMSIRAGRKHLKILDQQGRLRLIISKSRRKIDGPFLRAAKRQLGGAA
jgi:hypothetical protein